MLKQIETSTGFRAEIDMDIQDDYEFLEKVAEAFGGGTAGRLKEIELNRYVLGDKQYEALKLHCKGANGRVSASMLGSEMKEIMEQLPDSKKN